MKSASDWVSERSTIKGILGPLTVEVALQIQLDAYKQGMYDAAAVVRNYHHGCSTFEVRKLFSDTILSASDSKTSL